MNNFDDETNPFADSTVRKATPPSAINRPMNDNNPFANTMTPAQPVSPPSQTNTAAFLPSPQPPTYQPSAYPPVPTSEPVRSPTTTTVDLTDYERRQAELDAREKRIVEREQSAANQQLTGKRDINNFPPIPNFIPCRPCFYQDIGVEIPSQFQFTVRFVYYIWLFYSLTLLLNMIAALSYFLTELTLGAVTFGVSIVYFILFIPAAYIFWFRPIYRAFRDDSSVFFMIFFIIDAMFIVTNVLFALGFIEGIGFFRITGKKPVIKFMMAILGGLWSLIAAATIVITIRIHRLYRKSGASLEQAQKEFQTAFVNSPTVRGAAREAASAGINQALNSGDDRQPIYQS